MIKKSKKISFFVFTLSLFALLSLSMFMPAIIHAQSVGIPCDGPHMVNGTATDCGFDDFVQLAQNVMTFIVLLSIPVATVAFAWSGILLITGGGSESKISEAKEIFTKVLIGFVFVLTAWLIVRFITSALLNQNNYQDLLKGGAPSGMQHTVTGIRTV